MKAKFFVAVIGIILLSSCSAWFGLDDRENRKTSSLVKYLYGQSSPSEQKPEVPVLNLPVKVGVAFIPSKVHQRGIQYDEEIELLEGVKKSFSKFEYVDRIEIIPSSYLDSGRGFTHIEQVARVYDVDLIALVSYDQVARSSLNSSSLLYWTIVGAYIIPGNTNVTQTFVDTAVFDIKTRKLLFRAPGTDKVSRYTTAVGLTNTAKEESIKSFQKAVLDMEGNLGFELSRFKDRIKKEKVARVEVRKGYSGTGSLDLTIFFLILLIPIIRWLMYRSKLSSNTLK